MHSVKNRSSEKAETLPTLKPQFHLFAKLQKILKHTLCDKKKSIRLWQYKDYGFGFKYSAKHMKKSKGTVC